MERIRVPARDGHHGVVLVRSEDKTHEVVHWTTSRVEKFISTFAGDPWVESEITVNWKTPAGSNSSELVPVVVVRGTQLDAENIAEYLFGGGMACWHMSQKWREVKATIEDQDLFDVHWETALSIAAARLCSPFGWASYGENRKNLQMMSAWAYLLANPMEALGL